MEIERTVAVSVQTVSYHLDKLVEAGLVTDVNVWYSAKGAEMDVYVLAGERVDISLVSGDSDGISRIRFESQSAMEVFLGKD